MKKFKVWCKATNGWERDYVLLTEQGFQFHSKDLRIISPVKPDNHPIFESVEIEGQNFFVNSDIFTFDFLEDLYKSITLTGSFYFNDEDLCYEINIYNNERYVCLHYVGNGVFSNFQKIGTIQENSELIKGVLK
jgi:hypothetical protein